MLHSYFTVKEAGEHEIVIEKSRFICHLSRVSTEQEAQEFIQKIKKQHWNATHNCSAYVIGENDHIQKANDDGEPSGTAGVPMLEVLKNADLRILAPSLHGTSEALNLEPHGLIRAYGKSVSEGLNHIGVVERKLMRVMHTSADYTWLGKIENELRESQFLLKEIHYAENVEFEVYVEENRTQEYSQWILSLTNGSCYTKLGILIYLEKQVKNQKENK